MDPAYPVFVECLDYILDPFWKQLFVDLSKGKCPRGVRLADGTLTARSKDCIESVSIDQNPKDLYVAVINMLKNTVKLSSSLDKKKQKLKHESYREQSEKIYNGTWSQIGSTTIRQELLDKYVLSLKERYGMSADEARELQSFIKSAFLFKKYTSKDVVYENGVVLCVGDIERVIESGCFTIEEKECANIKEKIQTENRSKIDPQDKWGSYLDQLIKRSYVVPE